MKNEGGVTLTELMIAVALIGIGILGAVGTFSAIHQSIQNSKFRTLATNIAQEKLQIIMQKPYYEVLVTTLPATRTDVTPNITYDPSYFAPENLTEGSINFTRYTLVQVVQENSGTFQILPPYSSDTGMRQITETVVWSSNGGYRSLTMQSVLNNPSTVLANAVLTGTVSNNATGGTIPGALVVASENIGWRDTANATGQYSINMNAGSFNFQASAIGYYPSVILQTVAPNGSTTLNFSLNAIASGTVQGTAWIDNHLVISQVVASTGPSNGIEYVELYNPTTSSINMGTNATAQTGPSVWPVVWDSGGGATNYSQRSLVYISTYVPSYGYYLISNTGTDNGGSGTICSTFSVTGVALLPSACWRFVITPSHALQCPDSSVLNGCAAGSMNAGGFSIGTNGATSWSNIGFYTYYDSVGWRGTGTTPTGAYETTPITPLGVTGMAASEMFVRKVDTTTTVNSALGDAYDSGNNSTDFMDYGATVFPPRTTATKHAPITGTPATGAKISVTDGLSTTSTATVTGSPSYARFTVPGVATGTWVVFIDSGSYSSEIDTVSVVANSTTSIPNATTYPTWPVANAYSTVLSTNGIVGIVNGKVTDVTNTPIPGIVISVGGTTATSGSNGNYALRVSTGIYDVIANPGNVSSLYESQTRPSITVSMGDSTNTQNFNLCKGGRLSGWISRDGTNPLPGVTVTALDSYGGGQDTEVSGSDGRFTLLNLTTGTYTVQPTLDTKEVSTPGTLSATVTAGFTTWVGTFTITGAMGQVTGNVTLAGVPIKTGVLVVVSTQAFATPPALSSTTLTSSAFYADNSDESGSYSVDVRGSTSTVYAVTAFYMRLNNQTPVISTSSVSNVTVTAGQATPGVNFAW